MAQNTTIICPAGQWTLLTASNVSAMRAHNKSTYTVQLQATTDATAPTSQAGAQPLYSHETLLANVLLADLFPGISGAARVWAFSDIEAAISVSHA